MRLVPPTAARPPPSPQELMVQFPLKEIQSTRTQRPTASSSCPYVEIALGDVAAQRTVQLQLEQVRPAGQPGRSQPHSLILLTRLFSTVLAVPQGACSPAQGTELTQHRPELPVIRVVPWRGAWMRFLGEGGPRSFTEGRGVGRGTGAAQAGQGRS